MKTRKRKLKMKSLFLIICIFICFIFFICFISINHSFKKKFSSMGYMSSEVSLIMKKVPKKDYKYIKKYDKSIINLITSNNYKENNFDKYLKYYYKNSNTNIKYIIDIVNSGYDLMSYPASSLLSDLVKEKYYINDNVSRYLDYGNNHNLKANKIISIVNSKADYDFYTHTSVSNVKDGNLILVNKFYHLPDNYEPDDLVIIDSNYNQGTNNKLRKEAAIAFMKMVDGALLDNIILKNASAYRSYDYQVDLYNKYEKIDGKEKADIYSARPGYSEHQTGLCTDINTIDSSFAATEEAKWLVNNSYKYGFILRFPKGKEDVTGYKYEPWHYRYVGVDVAKVIYNENLTLEEYYAFYVKK